MKHTLTPTKNGKTTPFEKSPHFRAVFLCPEGANKMKNENNSAKGIGCVGLFVVLLGVAFIVMKIAGVIDWSWLWVLAPIWIYVGLGVIAVIAVLILAFISSLINK